MLDRMALPTSTTMKLFFGFIAVWLSNQNVHYTRGISPKRVTISCDVRIRGLPSWTTQLKETSQLWRAVGDTVSDLTSPRIEPRISHANSDIFNHYTPTSGFCLLTMLSEETHKHDFLHIGLPVYIWCK